MGEFSDDTAEGNGHRRLARFKDLAALDKGFPDTSVPGCQRTTLPIISFQYDGARNNRGDLVPPPISLSTAIPVKEGLSICYVSAKPGQGVLPHVHASNETLICIAGEWVCTWISQDGIEQAASLAPRDAVSIPAGMARRFECKASSGGEREGLLLAVVADHSPVGVFTDEANARIAQSAVR